ncbi:F-box only protein 15 isoform X2 [Trichomycterus rosablanca]|uniref:F-box only protein 15 isoform X2 n=1 Tax=Trichomycterus rosablanca TaxID=2290929 RepID=UPI002F351216
MSSARFHTHRKNHVLVQRSPLNPKPSSRSTTRRSESYLERLPPELIVKILSYLDAGSLFCISFVNKSFNELANDNATWYHLYSHRRANVVTSGPVQHLTDGLDAASVQEKRKGFWRRRFFRDLSGPHKDWRKELRVVHPYTGLPRRTAQLLRTLCIQWEITVRGVRGRENRTAHTRVYFSQASVTVSWTSGNWPTLDKPTTLEVHGVMPVPINCPLAFRPGRRSLLNTAVLNKGVGTPCGSDGLVRLLYIEKGLTLGVWKDQQEVAFVLLNLHHHRLVERNLLGSSTTMYEPGRAAARFDDLDPEYGLHSYSVHTELHNTETSITSTRFTQLHCRRDRRRLRPAEGSSEGEQVQSRPSVCKHQPAVENRSSAGMHPELLYFDADAFRRSSDAVLVRQRSRGYI